MDAADLRSAIEAELRGNLLPFWRSRAIDSERGGFIGEMANNGAVNARADKGLILNARLLWTFSALLRRFGDDQDRELASRARRILESCFFDDQHGGYFWRINADGRPIDLSKKMYGQAFCIYALSEHYLATGDPTSLAAARATYEKIEHHAADFRHGGYLEARAADWSEAGDLRLSDKDMNEAKSMNTHLHILEAYTNLYRAWPDRTLAARLEELVGLFGRYILSPDAANRHLRHFFDEAWTLRSDSTTYGHNIEAAWLLCEAAEVMGSSDFASIVRTWAIELAQAALERGVDRDGGLAYEGRNGENVNPHRDWWCQAEAVVGFWHVFELTGVPVFREAAVACWRFIERHFVDRDQGEWFWRVRSDGSVDREEPKVSEWKGPYHTVRMCLEMMRRLADENGASDDN